MIKSKKKKWIVSFYFLQSKHEEKWEDGHNNPGYISVEIAYHVSSIFYYTSLSIIIKINF
jgi:hypothetical protein